MKEDSGKTRNTRTPLRAAALLLAVAALLFVRQNVLADGPSEPPPEVPPVSSESPEPVELPRTAEEPAIPETEAPVPPAEPAAAAEESLPDAEAGETDPPAEEAHPQPPEQHAPEASVQFHASNVRVSIEERSFSLLDGVSAVSETGESLSVSVSDDGGFRMSEEGVYTVIYCAVHPVSGEPFSASRTVTVEDTRHFDNTHYELLKTYRDEISEKLTGRMDALTRALSAYLAEVTEGAEQVRLFLQADGASPVCIEADALFIPNWDDILIVFVAESLPKTDAPLDLLQLRRIPIEQLDRVFWDMTKVLVTDTGGALEVQLTGRTAAEMIELYHVEPAKAELIRELMQPDFQPIFASLTGNAGLIGFAAPKAGTADPASAGSSDVLRQDVVAAAYSLVGKVPYYWGGKYNALGWDPGWGLPRTVTVKGQRYYGQTSAYGLDCSGFVSWAFINAAQDENALVRIGNGTSNQLRLSERIDWNEALPGDLAFCEKEKPSDSNHVGIIVEVADDGTVFVAHCSSDADCVVVTEAFGSGFDFAARPNIYARAG